MIIEDMPFAEYLAIDAASSSALSKLASGISPLKLRDAPQVESAAMRRGTLLHSMALDQDLSEYAVAPQCDRRTKAGKEKYAGFIEVVADGNRTVVTRDDWDACELMVAEMLEHPDIGELLNTEGISEATVTGDRDGIPTKIRPDKWFRDDRIVVDLKKTRDASAAGFQRSIRNYGYDVQASWYKDRIKAETGADIDWLWIAIEDTPPYDCCIYTPSANELAWGRSKMERGFEIYKRCMESGQWPGLGWDWDDMRYKVQVIGDHI